MHYLRHLYILFIFILPGLNVHAADFVLLNRSVKASIVYMPGKTALDSISAHLLADDIQRITGYRPVVSTSLANAKGNVILIGEMSSAVIQKFLVTASAQFKTLNGKWERYILKVIPKPTKSIANMLLIAGSDRRGTAYGVFDISQKIGVSPWYWWADVAPEKKDQLIIAQPDFISSAPSVKYRGIFLNDEDWGLQPWAAKTFEPETKDIGPKTYAKIFELLLRLKANLIWPAMHPSTKAFYYYPLNKKVADDYGIVIGSSHAEPMLRNNVDEWDEKARGAFNYITNKEGVHKYWEDRVKETSNNEVVYTLGMRGVHDSAIEGVKTAREAVPVVERIIGDQRELLKKYVSRDATKIPQVFTAYKEVLEIYDLGLKLPDDVTLVWPDDNYGYIQRLNNEKESARSGGSGVYYHASYWGRPHDYLWLSSTHPALIREEMAKAFNTGARTLWVLNVGDIKPLEYNIQFFMDMAWDIKPFQDNLYTKKHMLNWNTKIFGATYGKPVGDILWKYYQLAFERRPEFMGWSQTEPTTRISYTEYDHFNLGDEAQKRIDRYDSLQSAVNGLRAKISGNRTDAFYELVYYPVTGASFMNKKFLYRDKSMLYARQGRMSAADYALASKQAYDGIVKETEYYNQSLAGGKWKFIMSMEPRKLPVYDMPVIPDPKIEKSGTFSIVPEGMAAAPPENKGLSLPVFNKETPKKYFVDIFLTNDQAINWDASVSDNWIDLSGRSGILSPVSGKKETRIWVGIDWAKAPKAGNLSGQITIKGGGKEIAVAISALNHDVELNGFSGYAENNGYVSIFAADYDRNISRQSAQWGVWDNIGHTGRLLTAPVKPVSLDLGRPETIKSTAPNTEYDFYIFSAASPEISFFSLPSMPLNNRYSMRFGVSIDDRPVQIIDFKTVGRSEAWKQNVLRNSAVSKIQASALAKGKHTLRIYMIDPGVMLDRIAIDMGSMPKAYGVIPETRILKKQLQ